jgi:phenylpropionate dioxygenase-like ring-hydroxylating dioxygenase large terminal subunit
MQVAVQHELIERFRKLAEAKSTQLSDGPQKLPASEYTSSEQLEQEREILFRRHPVVVALTADVPNPGDVLATHIDGVPLLVTRAKDGRARVFINACRHRGAPLVEPDCRRTGARNLSCPFHAWLYALDGKLMRRPIAQDYFNGEPSNLKEVSSDEAHGLILARLDGAPVDANAYLGRLSEDLDSFGLANFHHVETRKAIQHSNWKMIVDTFLETYHVFSLHNSSISRLYHSHPQLFDAFDQHCRSIGVRKSIDDIGEDRSTWQFPPHATIHYFVFPNTLVVHQLDHFEVWRIFPHEEPGSALVETSIYAPEPPNDDTIKKWILNLDILMQVTGQEDFPMCKKIQAGLDSGGVDSLVFGQNELGLIHFHEQIAEALCTVNSGTNR